MNQTESRISQGHPGIERIIDIDDPNVENHVKERIKEKLIEDAELLLERKKKQQEKRERVKKVQEELQRQREQKLKSLIQKKNKSDQVIEKHKDLQNKKIKQQQQYFQQIVNKNEKKSKQEIQSALTRQKELKIQLTKSVHKPNNNGLGHSNSNSTLNGTFNHSRYVNDYKFEKLSQELVQKAKKAQINHEKHNKLIVDRMRQKSENITNAQQKAFNLSMDEERQNLKNWGKKVESIETVHESIRSEREKKLIERRESFKNKLDKCNQNLRNLSYREQQKYDDLQSKFNRKLQPKQWRDPRLEKYYKLWQDNNKKIEYQKDEDANRILHKHQQITQQNRVYKTRKEKLIQTIKLI